MTPDPCPVGRHLSNTIRQAADPDDLIRCHGSRSKLVVYEREIRERLPYPTHRYCACADRRAIAGLLVEGEPEKRNLDKHEAELDWRDDAD